MTKKLVMALLGAMLICGNASAHENIWVDEKAALQDFKKIVLYPLSRIGENTFLLGKEMGTYVPKPSRAEVARRLSELQHTDLPDDIPQEAKPEMSPVERDGLWFRENDYLDRQMAKKLGVRTIRLGEMIYESQRVLEASPQYRALLDPFPSEQARAKAIEDATMADGYVMPRIRENRVQVDISPAIAFDVPMRTWMEETGGPNGNRVYNKREWVEHHIIPEKEMRLSIMDMEYTLYNGKGDKVLTCENSKRTYDDTEEGIFKDLSGDFLKSWKTARKGRAENRAETKGIAIGFLPVQMPDAVAQDECRKKAIQFAVEAEAEKLKNVTICRNGESSLSPQYHVKAVIHQYEFVPTWIEPRIDVSMESASHDTKWKDASGNEHTMTTTTYWTKITDYFAHWEFSAVASATMQLVDARTGNVVLSCDLSDADDKDIDAFRHVVRDFYKKANAYLRQ